MLSPVLSGGAAAGATGSCLVPWGDERVARRDPAAPVAGGDPGPVADPVDRPGTEPVAVLDDAGDPVRSPTAACSPAAPGLAGADPTDDASGHRLGRTVAAGRALVAVTGPGRARGRPPGEIGVPAAALPARMQLLLDEGPALLVCFGVQGWSVEGVYD